MNVILTAVISVTLLGLICSTILSIVSKLLHVKIDERITLLTEIMPQANCGACGYPGCQGYAAALIEENAKINLCAPGGSPLLAKISGILGVEAGTIEEKTAVVLCNCAVRIIKMEYKGINSCAAAKAVFSGEKSCAFGCIGYGDCKKACPSGAICIKNNLACIIADKCTGCGLCVKACPNNLIKTERADIPVIVACKNIEKGAVTRKKCSKGCIGCAKCVRECPEKAILIDNNLAVIDYSKCTGCGRCAGVCVTKCILVKIPD